MRRKPGIRSTSRCLQRSASYSSGSKGMAGWRLTTTLMCIMDISIRSKRGDPSEKSWVDFRDLLLDGLGAEPAFGEVGGTDRRRFHQGDRAVGRRLSATVRHH